MTKVVLKGNALGTGSLTLQAPDTSANVTIDVPDTDGTVVVGGAAAGSTDNVVTTKIPVTIGGVTYYLLATTSEA